MNPIAFVLWLAGLVLLAVMWVQTPRPRKLADWPAAMFLLWLALMLVFLIKTPHAVSITWN